MTDPATSPGSERLLALDLLRGLAVAGMVLVDSPGSWEQTFGELKHAAWFGATVADMVFPTFLFATGMALGLSFPRPAWGPGDRARLWRRVARRVALLILLGIALEFAPAFDPAHMRFPGILQRIALCYAAGAALSFGTAQRAADGRLHLRAPAIGAAIVLLLAGYWALLRFVPVPGMGAGQLDPAGNLAAYVDRALFTPAHLWIYGTDAGGRVVYDPEGLLSTLPATANLLFGLLAAALWRRLPARAPAWIAAAGVALVAAGLLIHPLLPLNKRIWTSSFALFSSGVSALLLAALDLLLRRPGSRRWLAPLRVLGGNAILAFVLSQLLGLLSLVRIGWPGGEGHSIQRWGFLLASTAIPMPKLASLACAVAVLAFVTLAIAPLHRRRVHFRL